MYIQIYTYVYIGGTTITQLKKGVQLGGITSTLNYFQGYAKIFFTCKKIVNLYIIIFALFDFVQLMVESYYR